MLNRQKSALEKVLKRGGAHLRRIYLEDNWIDDTQMLSVALENCRDVVEEICVALFCHDKFVSVAALLRNINEYNPAALRNLSFTSSYYNSKVDRKSGDKRRLTFTFGGMYI